MRCRDADRSNERLLWISALMILMGWERVGVHSNSERKFKNDNDNNYNDSTIKYILSYSCNQTFHINIFKN